MTEWHWMTTSDTTNSNEWQWGVQQVTKSGSEWQRVTTNDNEWQQTILSGTTNENDTVHFKELMTALKHKSKYTTSRDGWLQLEWLNK